MQLLFFACVSANSLLALKNSVRIN